MTHKINTFLDNRTVRASIKVPDCCVLNKHDCCTFGDGFKMLLVESVMDDVNHLVDISIEPQYDVKSKTSTYSTQITVLTEEDNKTLQNLMQITFDKAKTEGGDAVVERLVGKIKEAYTESLQGGY